MGSKYYKPKILLIGLLLFGVGMLCVGLLSSRSSLMVLSVFVAFIGEALILDAASYKVKKTEQNDKSS